jgi:apolipoprotein N-acyltransferase
VSRKSRKAKATKLPAGERSVDTGMKLRWRLLLCLLAGVLIFLSFPYSTVPDSNIWILAWFGLVPFLWALRGPISRKRGFWLGAFAGFVTNFGGFWWIFVVVRDFGHLPDAVAWGMSAVNAFFQGLAFAIVGYLTVRWRREDARLNIFVFAAIFTVVEFLYPMIFPWFLGNGQYRFLPVIQIAEITGVMGITFVLVAFNGAIFQFSERLIRKTAVSRRSVIGAVALMVVTLGYGVLRVSQVDDAIASAEKLKIGLVEANIGIWDKQARNLTRRERTIRLHNNLLDHQRMSMELAADGVDVIVWPESSYLPLDDPYMKRTDTFALGVDGAGQVRRWNHDATAGTWAWQSTVDAKGDIVAVDALREDAWAAASSGGTVVADLGAGPVDVPVDAAAWHDIAVAARPGGLHGQDGAPVTFWVVGEGGAVAFGDIKKLTRINTDTQQTLRAVGMRNGRFGVAVGDAGTLVELGPGRAKTLDVGIETALYDVWLNPQGQDAIAVGADGVVLSRTPKAGWSALTSAGTGTLRAVTADGDGLIVAGDSGRILRYDNAGKRWRALVSPVTADIVSATTDPRGGALFVDRAGTMLRVLGDSVTTIAAKTGIKRIAGIEYTRVSYLPRDVRYMKQGVPSVPTREAYGADPGAELNGVTTMHRTAVQRGFKTPIIFGGITVGPAPEDSPFDEDKYNTAIMLDTHGRVVGTYDKVYLLLFGEYMPLGDWFPSLYDIFKNAGRFTAGTDVKAFEWGGYRIGVMVCYEDILPKFTGKVADLDPNVIVNVTNDAWFGTTSEPYLHMALSIFRAVENRVMLIRSTNTGVSAFVDPTGRITGQTSMDGAETLTRDVPMMSGGTIYTRVGDLFSYLVAFGLIAWVILRWRAAHDTTPLPAVAVAQAEEKAA